MNTGTTALDKLIVSVVNIIPSIAVALLLYSYTDWRVVLVGSFLVYQLIVALTPTKRSIGMRSLRIDWAKDYPIKNHIIFALLYSLSFATAVTWIVFPFDVLLVNLLCIQLPMVLKTGYTLHGYLAGKIHGIRSP